jgi:glycosyltransferase involved in cell wall biosynthesis
MRILFATAHKHLPELHGGMEVNTHQLAHELMALGHEVGAMAGLKGIGWTGFQAKLRIKLGVSSPSDRGLGYRTWRAWDVLPVAERVTKAFRPDLIVLQGGHNFIPLLKLYRSLGLPVVGYLHNGDLLPLDVELRNDPHIHFIANSNFTASLHPDKRMAAVVRPLVPREPYATPTDRSAAVFINPSPYKGLDIVLALARARPDVKFLFVVNGMKPPPSPEELSSNIEVIGPFSDMKRVYARARVVLAPSKWDEAWGRIATEAHINGIPVLATLRGGLPEAVGPGGLCLAEDAPADQWLEAFAALWGDSGRYQDFVDASFAHSRREEVDPAFVVQSFVDVLTRAVG